MAYLQQLRELYSRLSMRQRILIGGAAVLVIGLLFGLRFWQTERNFKTLFQNLSAEDAGMVLARLKESGTEVRLEDGGKIIKVPSEKVDELRIQMASAGLPKSGRIGFELFDKPNFGTSEFAEQVNYHRAVEGELERSVMALQEVESARVHITFPRQSLFLENRQPAKASVLLKLKPGADLSKPNIQAITHLASSAVDGLTPENVSVLDMRGNLLSRPRKAGESDEETSKELIEYRERMERDLRAKIQATLEPLLGPDAFRAVVSLECDLASGDQSEESFDPSRSVMVNSQRSEDGSTPATATGVPGTPSNLPRPTSRPGSGNGNPLFRRSENTTFQTSRIVRHIKFPHGQVKRLSASVLLDHIVKTEGGKRVVEAPTPERIRAIKDIVSAAVGFQQERGDQIIVESLPFETTRNLEPVETAAKAPVRPRLQLPPAIPEWLRIPMEGHLNWLIEQNWLPAAAIALVLGILYGIYRLVRAAGAKIGSVLKKTMGGVMAKLPFGKKKDKGQHVDVTLDPSIESAHHAGELQSAEPHHEGEFKSLEQQLRERELLKERLTTDALLELEIPKAEVRRVDVLTRHLSELATKDSEAVANLIRTWTEGNGANL
ncbi:MAG: flagellar M-ring protein FliF [Bryobacterales bacterium]|nr:flagellar M-ring protein FliF [Bryobacterales bacterium]